MLTQTQLLMTAKMLEIASDTFSNHGCNDFYLDNTLENHEFVKEMYAYIGILTDSIYICPDRKQILVMNTHIMDYCRNILLKTAEEQSK